MRRTRPRWNNRRDGLIYLWLDNKRDEASDRAVSPHASSVGTLSASRRRHNGRAPDALRIGITMRARCAIIV